MTYTLTANETTIVRDADQAFIPADPDNVDYQKYLEWVEAGGVPSPYVPPEAGTAKEQQPPPEHAKNKHPSPPARGKR